MRLGILQQRIPDDDDEQMGILASIRPNPKDRPRERSQPRTPPKLTSRFGGSQPGSPDLVLPPLPPRLPSPPGSPELLQSRFPARLPSPQVAGPSRTPPKWNWPTQDFLQSIMGLGAAAFLNNPDFSLVRLWPGDNKTLGKFVLKFITKARADRMDNITARAEYKNKNIVIHIRNANQRRKKKNKKYYENARIVETEEEIHQLLEPLVEDVVANGGQRSTTFSNITIIIQEELI